MATNETKDLIRYFVALLADREIRFGKTKLVKLAYLADVESYRSYRRTATDFEWRFYHYGPYPMEFDSVLSELGLDIPEEEVMTAGGQRALVYRPAQALLDEVEKRMSPAVRTTARRLIDRWGDEDLNKLLDYVYFETPPMKRAHRGDVLDFSTIPPRDTTRRARIELPPEAAQQLRREMESYRLLAHETALITPPPRFDDVFEQAMIRMEREETTELTAGVVDISSDAKSYLRDPTDR